jgi:hypothetical protein
MTERLLAKLDRLGAEAGIKNLTPEIYRFAQLLNDDKLKQWDEWRQQRTWVGLTDDEILKFQDMVPYTLSHDLIEFARAIEAKLKEKNT